MAVLGDGERIEVRGSTSTYTLHHAGRVYSCTCPAWRNQHVRIEERTCKHLRAFLGDDHETTRLENAARDVFVPVRPPFVEDRDVREGRLTALARAIQRFPALDDRMQTVYGLRMPRHLAHAIGFWMGLDDVERAEATYLGTGPLAVGAWFLDGALDRGVLPGLDERLEDRLENDAPELVPVFRGPGDLRFGLFYDHPQELPEVVCAHASGETKDAAGRTLLEALRAQATPGWEPKEFPRREAVMAWLDAVLARELEVYLEQNRGWLGASEEILGGRGPAGVTTPATAYASDQPVEAWPSRKERARAYTLRAPEVQEWMARATRELEAGSPQRAVLLGRELHFVGLPGAAPLLVAGYRALGRHALADMMEVHEQHRGHTGSVYTMPPPTPFVTAAEAGDLAALEGRWTDPPRAGRHDVESEAERSPSDAEMGQALRTTSTAVLRVLVAHASAALLEAATTFHLGKLPSEAAPDRRVAALLVLMERGVRGAAWVGALASSSEVVRTAAISYADLGWRSAHQRTVLHHAAAVGAVDAVQALLERGVDATAEDDEGHNAHFVARHAREQRDAIRALLEARGAGPKRPAPPPEVLEQRWPVGGRVAHKVFGEGVIEAADGEGGEARLTVTFPVGRKVLVARFVTLSS